MTGEPVDRGAVVACLRVADLHPSVDPLTGAVRTEEAGLGLSAADAAALEHALRAGERWDAPVAAVCLGPVAVEPVLHDVAALGVAVLRVEPVDASEPAEMLATDEHGEARRVVEGVRAAFGAPRLVVCGDRSPERGTGAFPAFVAHELGVAQGLGLVSLSADPDGTGLVAERRLDGGWRERLRVDLPAVCSVEAAGIRLRRASLEGSLAGAGRSVPTYRPSVTPEHTAPVVRFGVPRPFAPRPRVVAAPSSPDSRQRVLALCGALEEREPPVVLGPLSPSEAADELLAFLARHEYRAVTEPAVTA